MQTYAVIDLTEPLDNGDAASVPEEHKDFTKTDVNKQSGFKEFFFTINNPDETKTLPKIFEEQGINCTHIVWCKEIGREGTPHYQGCFTLELKMKEGAMQNKFRAKAISGWVKVCINYTVAMDYINRTGKYQDKPGLLTGPFNYGHKKASAQGRRNDLLNATETLKKTKSMKRVAELHAVEYVKYHKGLGALKSILEINVKRDWKTEVHILTGVAGSGKSYTANKEAGPEAYYTQNCKEGQVFWWSGYNGQENIVIDEFYGSIQLHVMLQLMDAYPLKVHTGVGESTEFLGRKIWITSNKGWKAWYGKEFLDNPRWIRAFERRITSVRDYSEEYVEVDTTSPLIRNGGRGLDFSFNVPEGQENLWPIGEVGSLACEEELYETCGNQEESDFIRRCNNE